MRIGEDDMTMINTQMQRRRAMLALGALAAVALAPQAASAQAGLEGVWKITNITATGANASVNASPQPSQMILTRGYYSFVQVASPTPRKASPNAANPARLTDAEKLARYEEWNAFAANAGTYEV